MSDASVSEAPSRDRTDPTAELRVKARRRLIGAAVLLLAVVVVVPAVLDPTPRTLPDTIPIEIPSEKTPFTPRLSLPPLPEPAPDVSPAAAAPLPTVTPPTLPAEEKKAVEEKKSESKPVEPRPTEPRPTEPKSAEPKSAETKSAESKPADVKPTERAKESAKADRSKAEGKKFVLQAAAPASEAAAKELAERIAGTGLKAHVTKVDAKDGVRYRVRVGPYASRDEAERARARLRAAGINANLVAL